ncbi:hypothetical protein P7K49_032540 [Saguinus oedipus]|uniref:Uncharacterized protein n=1 Tax=Saguinus oedipus TaxID=9490 RepID=A0ABQ9TZC6_SAGOE|nr:hypothetical protein P7K49_032540 [Saguinus oedipus]
MSPSFWQAQNFTATTLPRCDRVSGCKTHVSSLPAHPTTSQACSTGQIQPPLTLSGQRLLLKWCLLLPDILRDQEARPRAHHKLGLRYDFVYGQNQTIKKAHGSRGGHQTVLQRKQTEVRTCSRLLRPHSPQLNGNPHVPLTPKRTALFHSSLGQRTALDSRGTNAASGATRHRARLCLPAPLTGGTQLLTTQCGLDQHPCTLPGLLRGSDQHPAPSQGCCGARISTPAPSQGCCGARISTPAPSQGCCGARIGTPAPSQGCCGARIGTLHPPRAAAGLGSAPCTLPGLLRGSDRHPCTLPGLLRGSDRHPCTLPGLLWGSDRHPCTLPGLLRGSDRHPAPSQGCCGARIGTPAPSQGCCGARISTPAPSQGCSGARISEHTRSAKSRNCGSAPTTYHRGTVTTATGMQV